MKTLMHPPTVGGIIKKIMEINPDLSAGDIAVIVKSAVRRPTAPNDGFSRADVVDNELAIELAKQSLVGGAHA